MFERQFRKGRRRLASHHTLFDSLRGDGAGTLDDLLTRFGGGKPERMLELLENLVGAGVVYTRVDPSDRSVVYIACRGVTFDDFEDWNRRRQNVAFNDDRLQFDGQEVVEAARRALETRQRYERERLERELREQASKAEAERERDAKELLERERLEQKRLEKERRRQESKERARAWDREYYARNKELINAKRRERYEQEKELRRAASRRRVELQCERQELPDTRLTRFLKEATAPLPTDEISRLLGVTTSKTLIKLNRLFESGFLLCETNATGARFWRLK